MATPDLTSGRFCHCCGDTSHSTQKVAGIMLCNGCVDDLSESSKAIYGNAFALPVLYERMFKSVPQPS
jgi:hypothetical protein